jgi:hypothetical protein
MSYFEKNWCDMQWTRWIKFTSSRIEWRGLPEEPGHYRVRPIDGSLLMYVGETGRGLRKRIAELRDGVVGREMPYDDPHTAAPGLWAWMKEENWDYESSAAPSELTRESRKTMECYLLWRYRLEKGETTLCNLGRFHKDYTRSTVRNQHVQGRKLAPTEQRNQSGGPSHPPLQHHGDSLSNDWMTLEWTDTKPLLMMEKTPQSPGLYRIIDPSVPKVIYIGQTKNLKNRLMTHRTVYHAENVKFSFIILPNEMLTHQRLELENDLIAGYYHQFHEAPRDQFGQHKSSGN